MKKEFSDKMKTKFIGFLVIISLGVSGYGEVLIDQKNWGPNCIIQTAFPF